MFLYFIFARNTHFQSKSIRGDIQHTWDNTRGGGSIYPSLLSLLIILIKPRLIFLHQLLLLKFCQHFSELCNKLNTRNKLLFTKHWHFILYQTGQYDWMQIQMLYWLGSCNFKSGMRVKKQNHTFCTFNINNQLKTEPYFLYF